MTDFQIILQNKIKLCFFSTIGFRYRYIKGQYFFHSMKTYLGLEMSEMHKPSENKENLQKFQEKINKRIF